MVFSTLSPMSGRETMIAGASVPRPRFELPPPKPSVALAVVAFTTAALCALVVLLLKLTLPEVSTQFGMRPLTGGDTPIALGGVSFLVILPIVLGIWLAHVALGPEREVPRGGRALAGAALGVGYLSVALWGVHVILALYWPQATGFQYGAFLLSVWSWT
jgi:hypothetical protein